MLSEYDNFAISYLNRLIEVNMDTIVEFDSLDIFPPILYICDNTGKSYEFTEQIYKSKDIKRFYYERMVLWEESMDENSVKMIREIRSVILGDVNNPISLCLLMFTLIEKLLLVYKFKEPRRDRYMKIISFIETNAFDDIRQLSWLHKKYIKDNLYNHTKKAKLFSRHSCHGKGTNKLNEKTLMSLIFIYDYLYIIFHTKN